MNYFLLAETDFFRLINEAGDCNMETAYTAFATQVIELCNGGMDTYFPLQNAIWSGARPAPDAPSSPRRAGGAGSELPRRKKGRCAHPSMRVFDEQDLMILHYH